jgi:hypothetical protein
LLLNEIFAEGWDFRRIGFMADRCVQSTIVDKVETVLLGLPSTGLQAGAHIC